MLADKCEAKLANDYTETIIEASLSGVSHSTSVVNHLTPLAVRGPHLDEVRTKIRDSCAPAVSLNLESWSHGQQ